MAPQPRLLVTAHPIVECRLRPQLKPVRRGFGTIMRSKMAANSVYHSLADIMDKCEDAWKRFDTDHGLIRSLSAVARAPASPLYRW